MPACASSCFNVLASFLTASADILVHTHEAIHGTTNRPSFLVAYIVVDTRRCVQILGTRVKPNSLLPPANMVRCGEQSSTAQNRVTVLQPKAADGRETVFGFSHVISVTHPRRARASKIGKGNRLFKQCAFKQILSYLDAVERFEPYTAITMKEIIDDKGCSIATSAAHSADCRGGYPV